MNLTNRPGGAIRWLILTTVIVTVVLSLLCISTNTVSAARSGNHHNSGWGSWPIGIPIQPTVRPVPTVPLPTIAAPSATPTIRPTPTPSQVPTPIPSVANPPSGATYNPGTIESIYGTPTPDPGKNHAAPAAVKPGNANTNQTFAWAISHISTMADLPLVNGAGSGAAASDSVSDAVNAKNGFSDLLIMVNILVPIIAVGLILYDQSRTK